jgi:uncharacterized protein YdhG (YjbR/CyaY superfamily)
MSLPFASIDAYIATFPADVQARLEAIRAAIRAAVPSATETISYNIPTFRLAGTYLLYFAGWKQHVSIYPVPPGDDALAHDVAPYRDARSTLKFPHKQPLPIDLIPRLVAARLAEIGAR